MAMVSRAPLIARAHVLWALVCLISSSKCVSATVQYTAGSKVRASPIGMHLRRRQLRGCTSSSPRNEPQIFSALRVRRRPEHSSRGLLVSNAAVASLDQKSVAKIPDFLPQPGGEAVEEAIKFFESKGMTPMNFKPAKLGETMSVVSTVDFKAGDAIMSVPSSLCVTRKDVDEDPVLGMLSEGQDTITALALWIMKERALGTESQWYGWFKTLPLFTYSPITWTEEERETLLKGSFVLAEANQRVKALESRWMVLAKQINDNDIFGAFDDIRAGFNFQAFCDAFSVVLAYSVSLDSIKQLALVPLTELLPKAAPPSANSPSNGNPGNTMTLDYDRDRDAVVLTSTGEVKKGDELYVSEPVAMSNAELLLQRGHVRNEENPDDFIIVNTQVVMADNLYTAKKQILDAYGLSENQKFLIYRNRLPLEMLSYLRLSRLQSTDDLLKLNFENDAPVSEMNEYEVLQLLLTEARMISAGYRTPDTDSDRFVMRSFDSSVPEKLAAQLRIGEKQVVSSFMDAVRTRLAPIRGIPTKKGMENQNQEILDMFETMENIPKAPGKFVKSVADWWTDERNWQDPDEKRQ